MSDDGLVGNVHEHLAAATATGVSLALPVELEHWLLHVLTSVFVGVCTWAVTHVIKAASSYLKKRGLA